MSAKVALQLNAVVGIASTLAVLAVMSLMLTRPEAIASAIAEGHYGAVASAVLAQVASWLHALLRYL
jgi:hypothetical protein